MALTQIELINGIFSLVFISIAIFIGLLIITKYFKYRQPLLLLVGFVWIIMSEVWWSSSFSFIAALSTGSGLTDEIYFFVGNLFVPLGILIWMKAFTDLIFKDKQKLILIIFTVICTLYYVTFIPIIFIDVSVIGEMRGVVDGNYTPIALVFLLTGLFAFVISGLIFAKESLKSDNWEIKLKGKFLALAFVLFGIGAGLDGLKPYFISPAYLDLALIIDRIILMFSAFSFYSGFILPRFIQKMFSKED